jgi:hypothetical protein
MDYLCRATGNTDSKKHPIVLHRESGLPIILMGKNRNSNRPLAEGELVGCTNLFAGEKVFFSNNYWSIQDKAPENLLRQGYVSRIFFDTSQNSLFVVGMWNDPYSFEPFHEISVGSKGNIARKTYILSTIGRNESVEKIFEPKYLGDVIAGNFKSVFQTLILPKENQHRKAFENFISLLCEDNYKVRAKA